MPPHVQTLTKRAQGWKYEADADEEDMIVDAHILAAPVFVDVDGDGSKEMIVPVSYFFDTAAAARYLFVQAY